MATSKKNPAQAAAAAAAAAAASAEQAAASADAAAKSAKKAAAAARKLEKAVKPARPARRGTDTWVSIDIELRNGEVQPLADLTKLGEQQEGATVRLLAADLAQLLLWAYEQGNGSRPGALCQSCNDDED